MPDIVHCTTCQEETYAGLPVCPHCGAATVPRRHAKPKPTWRPSTWEGKSEGIRTTITDDEIIVHPQEFTPKIIFGESCAILSLLVWSFLASHFIKNTNLGFYLGFLYRIFGFNILAILFLLERRPFLHVGPQGLVARMFDKPIPWDTVGDISLRWDCVRVAFRRPVASRPSPFLRIMAEPYCRRPYVDLRVPVVPDRELRAALVVHRDRWRQAAPASTLEDEAALKAAEYEVKEWRTRYRLRVLAFILAGLGLAVGGSVAEESVLRLLR